MKIYNESTWYDGIKKENELIEKEKGIEDISCCWEFCNIELGMVARVIVGIFTLGLSEAVFKCMRVYKAKKSETYGPRIVKGVSWYTNGKKKRAWDDNQSHSEESKSQTKRNRNRSRRNRQLGSRAPSRYGLIYRNGMPTRFWV